MFKKVRIMTHNSIKAEAWEKLLVLTAALCMGRRWLCRRFATEVRVDGSFRNSSCASTSQRTNKHSNTKVPTLEQLELGIKRSLVLMEHRIVMLTLLDLICSTD